MKPSSHWAWMMLPARTFLFAAFQGLIAGFIFLSGASSAWDASAAWWPIAVTLTNLVFIAWLVRLYRREGKNYWDIFRFQSGKVKSSLFTLLPVLLISGPVAMLPSTLMATWLFGDAQAPMNMFLRHLPVWAVYTSLVAFPITQAVTELPVYFAYIMPRLEAQTGRPWLALSLAALGLGIQHVAVPLVFDPRFMTWRLTMYIPFAFLVGGILRWRPGLLPYLAVVHWLMDLATAAMLFTV